MACFQMRSSVVVVVAMLLLLACCEASSASSSRQQPQRHKRKMLDPSRCSKLEQMVKVYQSPSGSLPTGMPSYSVEITNTNICTNCTVCKLHLSCGNFANTELVDPATFRRLAIDDCLVMDGGPIKPGEMVAFNYYNSFPYKMKVASASCDCA